ncbi:nuclear transport factor 2 family protein [Bacillus sp. HNG]|uniref:nuclear transport factor 2 family protein n=1 Tax=Bacillus sp. HNG TaxID=2293325 RepID=UPI000E2F9B53|nr:nuclear transport factor 2 family protein [Bacillus sp. HNG]RFB11410.1 nuclear transport factor 2 family protein [Bacillus sp. HNG]
MNTIEEVLNDYFIAWNKGFICKNGDGIRDCMSKSFIGYWAHSNIDNPEPYYYDYDLDSVLRQMDNAEKSFEIASITERKNGEEYLILGRETNTINGEPYSAQCMFVWRKEDNAWKLLREYIELER